MYAATKKEAGEGESLLAKIVSIYDSSRRDYKDDIDIRKDKKIEGLYDPDDEFELLDDPLDDGLDEQVAKWVKGESEEDSEDDNDDEQEDYLEEFENLMDQYFNHILEDDEDDEEYQLYDLNSDNFLEEDDYLLSLFSAEQDEEPEHEEPEEEPEETDEDKIIELDPDILKYNNEDSDEKKAA